MSSLKLTFYVLEYIHTHTHTHLQYIILYFRTIIKNSSKLYNRVGARGRLKTELNDLDQVVPDLIEIL